MLGFLGSLFTGGAGSTIATIATEFIQTDKESAEAKALLVKVLDPNGKMRRDLSRFACIAYGYYLIVTSILAFMVAFKFGDAEGAKVAAAMMAELFLPITTSWGVIVSASVGVNYTNVKKGAP